MQDTLWPTACDHPALDVRQSLVGFYRSGLLTYDYCFEMCYYRPEVSACDLLKWSIVYLKPLSQLMTSVWTWVLFSLSKCELFLLRLFHLKDFRCLKMWKNSIFHCKKEKKNRVKFCFVNVNISFLSIWLYCDPLKVTLRPGWEPVQLPKLPPAVFRSLDACVWL